MTFTASQIAAALAMKRQAVQWHLRAVQPDGRQVVNGNEAASWSFSILPATLQKQLEEKAEKHGYRNAESLLANPLKLYQPEIPLAEICEEDIQSANKLREALHLWLSRQHDRNISPSEMESQGVEDYRRVFGSAITVRYWRELFTRTIQRDRGAEQWNRIEIYLPERLRKKVTPAHMVSQVLNEDFAEIEGYIAGCGSPHNPSAKEREGIWTLAIEKVASLVGSGVCEKLAERKVRQYLFQRASFLAPTRNALRMAFERKQERFQIGGATALADGRHDNGEEFKLPEDDRDLLVHRAVFYYRGDIAPAWRALHRGREFSLETLSRYSDPLNKSHVPTSVRESVAPEVEILTVMHQGKRAFDSIKGHVTRSYEGISSLQCVSGDDFTLNTYFYVPDGQGWFNLTRGQVILFIDFRSLRILGWAMEPRKSYSSLTIRSLCTHIFTAYGVPEVLYFERGLWKSASLLKGKTDPFTFAEISQGLREFGITFKHAIRPRTKAVERIGGMFQDIAEAEPGYCGRDERRDAPEALRKQMAEVEARKVHPSKYFYSLDQWNHRIGQLVEQYNTEVQQGRILAGLSPDQAFERYINCENPPLQFPAHLRYLLAHDKRLARITLNGITIQVGKQKFNYRGQQIAHLVGRDVLAWFDPENPESIVVTDQDRTNPICVERSQSPNALESLVDPESETLSQELARVEHQASHMKTRFNVVKAKFPLPSRVLLNAAQSAQLGEEIAAQKDEISSTQKQQRRQKSQARQFAQRTGIAMPESAQGKVEPDRLRDLEEFLKEKDTR